MKTPIHCPICKEPLLNEFHEYSNKEEYLIKRCQRNPNHNFSCLEDTVGLQDAYFTDSKSRIIFNRTLLFNFYNQIIRVTTIAKGRDFQETYLPYFEPDFDNYPKMMERIEMLLTFS